MSTKLHRLSNLKCMSFLFCDLTDIHRLTFLIARLIAINPLMPTVAYGHSCKAICARSGLAVICNF